MTNRVIGRIKTYFPDKGYGFISSPSYNKDIYFHYTFIEKGEESKLYEILNSEIIMIMAPVSFIVRINMGNLQATNIRLLGDEIKESPTAQIAEFLRSPRSMQENAFSEFLSIASISKFIYIERDPELRKLVILRITRSTPVLEKLVDLAKQWVDIGKVMSNKRNDEEAHNIIENFLSVLTTVLHFQTLSEAELIDIYSAVQVKLVKPTSPIRWLRQADEVNLIIFANARSLRQCIQKDPTFVQYSNRCVKIIILLDEDDINITPSDPLNFSDSQVAIISQKQIIQIISSPNTDDFIALGRVFRSFLPSHLMQPFEVGSEYSRTVFSGRDNYRNQILDSIDSNYAIYGGRKIGKSWFLKDLCYHHCLRSQYNNIYVPIYISVQGTESIQDTADMISEKILEKFHIPVSESVSSGKRLLYYLRKTHELTGKKILLAVDEVDDILNMEGSSEFFGSLRAFQQNNPKAIKFVFAGFKELMKKLIEQVTNFPLANLFGRNHFSLSCLDKFDSEKLIVEPLKWAGLEFDESEVVETIYGFTSGHPYYTQAICQTIVDDRLKQNSLKLSATVIKKLASLEIFSEVSDIFEDNLSSLQKLIGKVCSAEQKIYTENEIKEALERRFGIQLSDKQIREELRVLIACSVFVRSESGYEPLMPQINRQYFGDKDDTILALAYLEGQ
jgi:hypothetical protein